MWCIIQIENHPDRHIEAVFGPYDEQQGETELASIEREYAASLNPRAPRLYNFELRWIGVREKHHDYNF